MRALRSTLAVLLWVLLPNHLDAQPIPIAVLQDKIAAAAKDSAAKQRLLLDPRLIEAMVANVILYTENFCPTLPQECQAIFGNGGTLNSHMSKYLAEVASLPPTAILSLAGILSKGQLEKAGWSSKERLNAGLLTLPKSIQDKELKLRYATAEKSLGRGAIAILMAPGAGELIVVDNEQRRRFSFNIERLKATELRLATAQSKDAGGHLDASLSLQCYEARPVPISGPFGMYNDGRAKIVEATTTRMANLAPYATQVSVNIGVDVDPSVRCTHKCKAAMASLLAEAIATWRSGCNRCDPNALVVINTMGTTWMDWRIARRLEMIRSQPATPLDLNVKDPQEVSQTIFAPTGGLGPGVNSYVDVTNNKGISASLCKLTNNKAPWVQAAKSYLCPGEHEQATEKLRPSVVLRKDETACGKIAVACGLPSERVEVNMSQYRYLVPSNGGSDDLVIGADDSSTILEMRSVILHEVGHWFGIPHAEVGGKDAYLDLMSERYGSGRACISPHSLRMLSNASDLRWKYRIQGGGGALLPPLDKKTSRIGR